jgi:hypothetical protein
MQLTPHDIDYLAGKGFAADDIDALLSGRASLRARSRRPKLPRFHAQAWRRSLGHWKFAEAACRNPWSPKWGLAVRFVPDDRRRSTGYSFGGRHPFLAEVPSPRRRRRLLALYTRAAGC